MEDSTVEIFINQLKKLVRAKNRYVENKRWELYGAFSDDSVSDVLPPRWQQQQQSCASTE